MTPVSPSNETAEQAILGAAFLSDSYLEQVLDQVHEDDYTRTRHRLIHRAIAAVHQAGGGINQILVSAYLRDHGQLEDVGGEAFIHGLADTTPISVRLDQTIVEVKELSARRRIIDLALSSISEAQTGERPASDVLRDLATAADNASAPAQSKRRLYDYDDLIRAWHAEEVENHQDGGIRTGLPTLDEQLGSPFMRGEVVFVAARSGAGKTWLLLQLVTAALQRRAQASALVATLEMRAPEVAHRLLAQTSRTDPHTLAKMALVGDADSASQLARDSEPALDRCRFIDAPSGLDDLPRDLAAMRKQSLDPHLVALDYVGLVKPRRGENPKNAYERTSRIALDLKAFAKEENVVVIAAVQLSRDAISEGKRPSVEKLRDSGQLEEAADRIIGVWDPAKAPMMTDQERMSLKDEIRVCVLKNRKGSQDGHEIELHYHEGRGLYEPADPTRERWAA